MSSRNRTNQKMRAAAEDAARMVRESQPHLVLERRTQADETFVVGVVSVPPVVDEDYWSYRVQLGHGQAVLGFPKHSTIGVGFALEDDWNTNLPYRCETDDVVSHILHNKRFECISDEAVRAAVLMVQEAAVADIKDPRGGVGSLGPVIKVPWPEGDDEAEAPRLLPCPDKEEEVYVVIYDEPVVGGARKTATAFAVDVVESYYGFFSSVEQARDQFGVLNYDGRLRDAKVCRVVEAIEP